MIEYTVVIPVKDRNRNLACSLMALAKQTFPTDRWEVLVADGSESDFALPTVARYADALNIRYLWWMDGTGNPGARKTWAAHNAQGEALVFVDSDVVLNERALAAHDRLHRKWPNAIICGRYDWLMPMDVREEDIAERFDAVVSNRLPLIAPATGGPLPGVDPRFQDERTREWDEPSRTSKAGKPFALGVFGGNLLIPKALFMEAGGFDPEIRGHGGEDSCLGWKLQKMGAEAVFSEEVIGWHVWHPRRQVENEESVKRNIEYIERKYHDLHVKYGVIADPDSNMEYNDDGLFVPPDKREELGI